MTVKIYTFTDGSRQWVRSMSKAEIRYEEMKHGKLISVETKQMQHGRQDPKKDPAFFSVSIKSI